MFAARTGSYNLGTSKGSDYTQDNVMNPIRPKFYIPICLLSVLGKLQEKRLCRRLEENRLIQGVYRNQYDFKRGRALDYVKNGEAKYIIAVFVSV